MEAGTDNEEHQGYEERWADGVLSSARSSADGLVKQKRDEARKKEKLWPTCRSFTITRGKKAIEDYMKTWDCHSSWQFIVQYVSRDGDAYRYRALWSQPTRRAPIPKATASVFFVIDAPPGMASDTVKVSFVVEGQEFIHFPGTTTFREKWLRDVVECKLILQDQVNF